MPFTCGFLQTTPTYTFVAYLFNVIAMMDSHILDSRYSWVRLGITLTMVGFALGNLVIGRAVDRFGVTKALIGAAIMIAAGFALAAVSGSILLLSAMQFFIGFGTAASFGPLIADISHWFYRRRGIAVAIAASGNYLSGASWS